MSELSYLIEKDFEIRVIEQLINEVAWRTHGSNMEKSCEKKNFKLKKKLVRWGARKVSIIQTEACAINHESIIFMAAIKLISKKLQSVKQKF